LLHIQSILFGIEFHVGAVPVGRTACVKVYRNSNSTYNMKTQNGVNSSICMYIFTYVYTSVEAFVATESNEMFSGRQQRQDVKVFRRIRNQLRPYLEDVLVVC